MALMVLMGTKSHDINHLFIVIFQAMTLTVAAVIQAEAS